MSLYEVNIYFIIIVLNKHILAWLKIFIGLVLVDLYLSVLTSTGNGSCSLILFGVLLNLFLLLFHLVLPCSLGWCNVQCLSTVPIRQVPETSIPINKIISNICCSLVFKINISSTSNINSRKYVTAQSWIRSSNLQS